MSRSLKYEIPGVDPRVSLDEVVEKGWPALFSSAGAASLSGAATVTGASALTGPPSLTGAPAASGAPALSQAPALAGAAAPRSPRPRVLEIGFGRGEFLLELAARSPGVDFLGIEVSFKRTLKMARKVARAGLANIRLVEAVAERVVPEIFEPASLDAIWINFSDPWPKVRHGHRRVIQPAFVAHAAAALRPEGLLYVATDDVPYAHQIDEVLSGESRLCNCYAPWPFLPDVPGQIPTGYEVQWRAVGRPMHFFAYARRPEGSR